MLNRAMAHKMKPFIRPHGHFEDVMYFKCEKRAKKLGYIPAKEYFQKRINYYHERLFDIILFDVLEKLGSTERGLLLTPFKERK